jgi:beta-N-acetylhexosaminidase
VAAVLVAGLLLAGCSSGAGPRPPAVETRTGAGTALLGAATGTSRDASFRPLPVATGWGPSLAEIDRARTLVGRLSLRQRAGQVIVASYSGTAPPTSMVRRLHLGGVIVFSENVTSAAGIRAVNQALQASVARSGRQWPLLIGVDQEGGLVQRVTGGATGFPTFMSAGAADDLGLTRRVYAASGAELRGLGFNLDFAPDADVTMGADDPAIGARSAGSSPDRAAEQVRAAADGFASAGLVPVVKHFPGHGSVSTDSHLGLPVQQASLRTLEGRDLVPFKASVRAHAPAVMVGHLDVRAVDPHTPSSLSHAVVTGLLRHRLGFGGVAFTDSLVMKAVTDRYGEVRPAVKALQAGEDALLMPRRPRTARDAIVRAVRTGRLDQARLDQAATRFVALMLHQRAQRSRTRPPGSSTALSQEYSARAITVVSGPCSGRLVGTAVRVAGPATAVARFRAAAASAGLRVVADKARPRKKQRAATRVVLLGPGQRVIGRRPPGVVVALDTPYVLGSSTATVARIATYGDTWGAMEALVDVLLGRSRAPGHLPVAVAGVDRSGC